MTAPDSAALEKLLADNPQKGPWGFTPGHIEEGEAAVRLANGDYVCTASSDATATLIALAPTLAAEVIALRAKVAAAERRADEAIAHARAMAEAGDRIAAAYRAVVATREVSA